MIIEVYSKLHELPDGQASDRLTAGCIVLEGGAFRGLYTSGVLDALMEADINMQCTVGVSAGALNGMNYVSGQIGRSGRINLLHRHDSRYVGLNAFHTNRGIIGFDFVLDKVNGQEPFNRAAFERKDRRFVAVVSNCLTGRPEYHERGNSPDIMKAIRASASMPYVSKPVMVGGAPCLDGGCTDKIPFAWAMQSGYRKIIVVKTRPDSYRKPIHERSGNLARKVYRSYPEFAEALADSDRNYNAQCDEIERLKKEGRLYVISPSSQTTVSRLERDMEKLGEFYYLGYRDTKTQLADIRAYLENENP